MVFIKRTLQKFLWVTVSFFICEKKRNNHIVVDENKNRQSQSCGCTMCLLLHMLGPVLRGQPAGLTAASEPDGGHFFG